jgi:hypothetical protein
MPSPNAPRKSKAQPKVNTHKKTDPDRFPEQETTVRSDCTSAASNWPVFKFQILIPARTVAASR